LHLNEYVFFIRRGTWAGLLLTSVIGVISYFVGPYVPGVGFVLLGLILGMTAGNFFKVPAVFSDGISYSSSKMLEFSVVMLAFGMQFSKLEALGFDVLAGIAICLLAVLVLTYFLSRWFRCPGSTGILTGFGTAICGSSAIAAAAPGMAENKEDVGIALAVINLLGAAGMLLLPAVLPLLPLSLNQIGFLIGGSLHSVANVAGAGYALGDEIGQIALSVKMIRVALLSPMVIIFSVLVSGSKGKTWKEKLRLPPYLWAFIAVTALVSIVELPTIIIQSADLAGKIALTVAMTAIGFKLSIRTLYQSGKAAMGFGVILFAAQFLLMALIMAIVGFD
jgi:uncharacterized integral membrane protein (TIGR00698 family)